MSTVQILPKKSMSKDGMKKSITNLEKLEIKGSPIVKHGIKFKINLRKKSVYLRFAFLIPIFFNKCYNDIT